MLLKYLQKTITLLTSHFIKNKSSEVTVRYNCQTQALLKPNVARVDFVFACHKKKKGQEQQEQEKSPKKYR